MKHIILAALVALVGLPAHALKVTVNDSVYDVKALVKIDKLKKPPTPWRYHYTLNDRTEELILSQPILSPEIPDVRPEKEQHPIKHKVKVAWKWFKRAAEVMNIAAMVRNSLPF